MRTGDKIGSSRSKSALCAAVVCTLLLAALVAVGIALTWSDGPRTAEAPPREDAVARELEPSEERKRVRVGDAEAITATAGEVSETGDDEITLILVSNTTGRPVADAFVVGGVQGGPTDARGVVHVKRPATRTVTVHVLADGFARTSAEYQVEDRMEIRLAALGRVDVLVVDAETQEPVADADVDLRASHDALAKRLASGVSGSDGRATLGASEPGRRVTVRVRHADFAPESRAVEIEASAESTLTIEMSRGQSIAGVVVRSDGKPARAALVRVVAETDAATLDIPESSRSPELLIASHAWRTGRADADGRFEVTGLRADTTFVVSATGRDGRTTAMTGDPAAVARGVRLVLPPDATLLVGVRIGSEPAPEGTRVRHTSRDGWTHEGERDEEGRFVLTGLPNGKCELVVAIPNRARRTSVATVEAGATAEHSVDIAPGHALRGIVRTTGGDPIANARVTVIQGESKVSVRSAVDGTFEVLGLEPGTVRCRLAAPDHIVAEKELAVPGQAAEIELTRKGIIVLRVRTPGTGDTPSVRLRTEMLLDETTDRWERWTRTLRFTDGVADVRFPTLGPSRLIILPKGYAHIVVEASPTPGQVLDLGEVTISSGLTLTGVVKDDRGEPAAGVRITATQAHAQGEFQADSDEEGRFRVERLADAPLTLTSNSRRYSRTVVEIVRPTSDVALTITPLAHLVVHLIGEDQDGARVVCRPIDDDERELARSGVRDLGHEILTRVDGRTDRHEGWLEPGRWRVEVAGPRTGSVEIDVEAGSDPDPVELRLD